MKPDTIREQVARGAQRLTLGAGDTVMVHSAVRSLGLERGNGGAALEAVLRGLLDAVGPGGTLLFPALSYKTVCADNPFYDARTTTGCVGAFAEFVRLRPGTLRSTHPTHSVCAIGRRAEELTTLHRFDETPVGQNSPFSILPRIGGKTLMLGCGGGPNTSLHGVEELVEPPYLYSGIRTVYQCTDMDGNTRAMRVMGHGFDNVAQHYERVETLLTPEQELWRGRILAAECIVMDAAAVWEKGRRKLIEAPYFFIDKITAVG